MLAFPVFLVTVQVSFTRLDIAGARTGTWGGTGRGSDHRRHRGILWICGMLPVPTAKEEPRRLARACLGGLRGFRL